MNFKSIFLAACVGGVPLAALADIVQMQCVDIHEPIIPEENKVYVEGADGFNDKPIGVFKVDIAVTDAVYSVECDEMLFVVAGNLEAECVDLAESEGRIGMIDCDGDCSLSIIPVVWTDNLNVTAGRDDGICYISGLFQLQMSGDGSPYYDPIGGVFDSTCEKE